LNAGLIILILKVAVVSVTGLFLAALVALGRGNYVLHGRINTLFCALTLAALVGLEFIARLISPEMFNDFFERHQAKDALKVHLSFSLPAAGLLLAMLFTGKTHRRRLHIGLGMVFLLVWTGTVVTGVFFLPHTEPPQP